MKAYSNLILKPDQTKQTQKQEKWGFYMEDGQKKKTEEINTISCKTPCEFPTTPYIF